MQVVWYLLHIELNDCNTQLIQTRRAVDTKQKRLDLVFIELEKSTIPTSLIQKDSLQQKGFIGTSKEIHLGASLCPIYDNAVKVAQAESIHVLIQGATGTGKEHLAKFIHDQSSRRFKELLTVNCSAFTDELLLSELFGHVKGSFTGAIANKTGMFVQADSGSIFLDEIGDISLFAQQALQRVLQNGEVRPIGSNRVINVDVRVITATHKNLKIMCSKEEFRWDLYYRLTAAKLSLPSLLDRGKEEMSEYLDFLINQVQEELNKPKKLKLSRRVKDYLLSYSYTGNLREMHNIISTLYVFYDDQEVNDFEYLPRFEEMEMDPTSLDYEEVEKPFMKKHIEKVLRLTHGNIAAVARKLGWAQNTLRGNAEKVGLDFESFR